MKYVAVLFLLIVVASCQRAIPADDDETRATSDTLQTESGAITITIENDGEWGGVIEQ